MTRRQKLGQENSATRTAILDAAEILMQEEGYAAVTSRRLGAKAEVRPQLVHYYFATMDDLFLAVLRRRAERGLELATQTLETDRPLRVLWEQSRNLGGAAMHLEFLALANHRKVIRTEMARYGERLRQIQEDALVRYFRQRGIEPQIPPGAVTMLMASVGLLLVVESTLGMSHAHLETEALVEDALRRFESGLPPGPVMAGG